MLRLNKPERGLYAKIFSQIYDGTLATNGPWEALVTFQQMLILADQEGQVDLTPAVIARRTTIPLELIEKGIAALELPDDGSRTPDMEGRRIVLLSEHRQWGWKIVNYEKYRKIKREEDRREYHRSYYEKHRSKSSTSSQHNSTIQPIAEAEAKAIKKTSASDDAAERFDAFWSVYPRKVGKDAARKAFNKRKVTVQLLIEMKTALSKQMVSEDWRKDGGKFIPHPSTWLNEGRWQDEVGIDLSTPVSSAADETKARLDADRMTPEQREANRLRAQELRRKA